MCGHRRPSRTLDYLECRLGDAEPGLFVARKIQSAYNSVLVDDAFATNLGQLTVTLAKRERASM